MARYIDADALKNDILMKHKFNWEVPCSSEDRIIQRVVTDIRVLIERSITADVVERSECEKWYHEYHVIKDALKQEKEYHGSTEKLADKYQVELEAMRGAANSYKMHYENAKTEIAREIFWEIDKLLTRIITDDEDGTQFIGIDMQKYYLLKKKYLPGGDGDGC